ncbi:hypothetical protein CR513_39151, partial [Mucuna pruriens]
MENLNFVNDVTNFVSIPSIPKCVQNVEICESRCSKRIRTKTNFDSGFTKKKNDKDIFILIHHNQKDLLYHYLNTKYGSLRNLYTLQFVWQIIMLIMVREDTYILRYSIVKHLIKNGDISLEYVKSEKNLLDPFTKGLPRKIILDMPRG